MPRKKQLLDYGIVGNCKTCALIKQDASVDWMCYPAFNSPSAFARILDDENGGTLQIKPVGKYAVTQRYIPNTAILETTFTGSDAAFTVTDFFPRYRRLLGKHKQKLFKQNRLVRILTPTRGTPKITVRYDPKPDYARSTPELIEKDEQILTKNEGETISLITNIPHHMILNEEEITLTKRRFLIVGNHTDPTDFSVRRCLSLLRATKKYWEGWTDTLILPEQNRETIIRSAITLKLLTFSETGAILAAPTTSIPEQLGTDRAFDYRFCWARDAAFCVDALKKIGRDYEPKKLMEFLMKLVMKQKETHIMYGIHGETDLHEETLHHLKGFQGTSPVKLGNPAHDQKQHDVYGSLIDIIYLYFGYYQYEDRMPPRYWRFLEYLVGQIEKRWDTRDSGIWEFRGELKHHVYSKVMCWVGVDRAIKLAQHFGKTELAESWIGLRDDIRTVTLREGYNTERRAFTMYFGADHLDAAVLQMTYHDFLPPDDPRMVHTVQAIYEELANGDLVQRYNIQDDFGMSTSAFTICSFWLIDSLAYIGEREKAQKMYDKLLGRANHLGLFSEDIDIASGLLIGNFPQGYTHIALINSSIMLSEWAARRKAIDWTSLPKRKPWF